MPLFRSVPAIARPAAGTVLVLLGGMLGTACSGTGADLTAPPATNPPNGTTPADPDPVFPQPGSCMTANRAAPPAVFGAGPAAMQACPP